MGSTIKEPFKEVNTQKQGRSGSGTKKNSGPAVGNARSNKTNKGGINRPTKGKMG